MKNTMTVKECAEYIGKSQQAVRIGLQLGGYKFGTAIQTVPASKFKPRGSWDYHICRQAVEYYMKYGNIPIVFITEEEHKKLGEVG